MIQSEEINNVSHRRLNVLTNEWVQVSPHRAKRPWQGQVEKSIEEIRPQYDEGCYLCPNNIRANGEHNPNYDKPFSFINDFAAIGAIDNPDLYEDGLLKAKTESGICKVICFSPRHDLTIPEMENDSIADVIKLWIKETKELAEYDNIKHIQIFENKGAVMGCSNPHPHGQIWAQESIPVEPAKKQLAQAKYYQTNNKGLLGSYLMQEMNLKERLVYENDHFVVLVPFWAFWPFETMILPKRSMSYIYEMSDNEIDSFADAYKVLTTKYDNLFDMSFPYSAGIHQAPVDGNVHPEWHWHMVFYPPLLRSAKVKKFMVGYEMLANPQRDTTPEYSAQVLREAPVKHFKNRNRK